MTTTQDPPKGEAVPKPLAHRAGGTVADGGRRGLVAPIAAFFVGLSLLVGVGAVAFYFVTTRSAGSLSDRVAAALARVTSARVSVEANTVTVNSEDIAELAIVSRRIQTIVKYESEFLGSDSILILRGEFDVKAGFDLTEPFEVAVDSTTGKVVGEFPSARILAVELRDYDVFHAKEGLWNRLTPETQEGVTRQLLDQARRDAERSDIVREAEAKLATRLQDLLDGADTTVRIGGRLHPPVDAAVPPQL